MIPPLPSTDDRIALKLSERLSPTHRIESIQEEPFKAKSHQTPTQLNSQLRVQGVPLKGVEIASDCSTNVNLPPLGPNAKAQNLKNQMRVDEKNISKIYCEASYEVAACHGLA